MAGAGCDVFACEMFSPHGLLFYLGAGERVVFSSRRMFSRSRSGTHFFSTGCKTYTDHSVMVTLLTRAKCRSNDVV